MATVPDLWGEIGPVPARTPVSILREQASLLSEKTNHLIGGSVESRVFRGRAYHSLNLVVPSMDDYTFQLLQVEHQAGALYPVYVGEVEGKATSGLGTELRNEAEFVEWLSEELSAPETKRIIANLLALVPPALT